MSSSSMEEAEDKEEEEHETAAAAAAVSTLMAKQWRRCKERMLAKHQAVMRELRAVHAAKMAALEEEGDVLRYEMLTQLEERELAQEATLRATREAAEADAAAAVRAATAAAEAAAHAELEAAEGRIRGLCDQLDAAEDNVAKQTRQLAAKDARLRLLVCGLCDDACSQDVDRAVCDKCDRMLCVDCVEHMMTTVLAGGCAKPPQCIECKEEFAVEQVVRAAPTLVGRYIEGRAHRLLMKRYEAEEAAIAAAAAAAAALSTASEEEEEDEDDEEGVVDEGGEEGAAAVVQPQQLEEGEGGAVEAGGMNNDGGPGGGAQQTQQSRRRRHDAEVATFLQSHAVFTTPCCGSGMAEFTGCAAIGPCDVCDKYFCAFCLHVQTGDVHRHVEECPRNPTRGVVWVLDDAQRNAVNAVFHAKYLDSLAKKAGVSFHLPFEVRPANAVAEA